MKRNVAVVLLVIVAVVCFWMCRYTIVPIDQYAYRLDRWTGEVTLLRGQVERDVVRR